MLHGNTKCGISKIKKRNVNNKTEILLEYKLVVTSGEMGWARLRQGIKKYKLNMYEINKRQGCIVQHKKDSQCFIIDLNGV